LGVEITPLVAGLGVGGIAVALALQSTLSNYFAGIYIAKEKAIKIGDFVQLENGLTGHVYEIGWRTTKIKTPTDNMIVIPNSNLSNMIVTNYHEPAEEMSVSLACGVSYESDLEKVEKVTTDVAKKVLRKMPGGVKNFEPVVRYKEFGDSNINFSVILRVKSYSDQFLVIHEFIKELMKAYKKNKIEISYPVRKIYETKTKAS
jgi:small-conductance mechanosensitive channel